MSETQYRIPSVTEESRTIVTAAEALLVQSPETPAHVALGLDSAPSEADSVKSVEDARRVFEGVKHTADTFARLRFEGVRLAYANGQVGKGKPYGGQRDLARALGMTQPRVSQILKAQTEQERQANVKSVLRSAAKAGGIDVKATEGLAATIHAAAVDASPEDVKRMADALQTGTVPEGPARTLDVDALVRAAETLLTLSGDTPTTGTDTDAVRRVVAMLTTARANLNRVLVPASV